MSITFKSRQPYYEVPHEILFHVGVRENPPPSTVGYVQEMSRRATMPASHMINKAYRFLEGENHDRLTLSTDVEIEAMRAFAGTTDNLIVELDADENEPAEPEGTPFIANKAGYILYHSLYKEQTPAEGKVFRFNMGSDRNKYITTDVNEIAVIRGYIKTHANCGIKDPTYVPPFEE